MGKHIALLQCPVNQFFFERSLFFSVNNLIIIIPNLKQTMELQ